MLLLVQLKAASAQMEQPFSTPTLILVSRAVVNINYMPSNHIN